MSNEIADALRRFADDIERGGQVPNTTEACIVLGNADGLFGATYVGRKMPARDAGIFMLTNGIQRFVVGTQRERDSLAVAQKVGAFQGFGSTKGSTH